MKPVKIGLLGLGTVGQGVATILARNAADMERRIGRRVVIHSAAVRDLAKAEATGLGLQLTTDPTAVVADPAVNIVVEAMGGEEPAMSLMMAAIEAGKPVITANKALIATHGNTLFEAARRKGVFVGFEPAVAAGIPVIKAIREGLAANEIEWLAGIINGTGNFILSEMAGEQRGFADVLAEAQALGYAEADPTFDVEGIDAAHKLAILAAIAFGIPLQFESVYTEGISRVAGEDVAYAKELGYIIKHLGVARRRDGGVELRVHPTLVPESRLLANVNGVMNAVLVKGNAVGPTLYYGPGAGAEATGSAVIADIIDAVRSLSAEPEERVPYLGFQPHDLSDLPLFEPADFESAYFLRLQAEDKPGVLADIAGIFGSLGISIEALIQKEPADAGDSGATGTGRPGKGGTGISERGSGDLAETVPIIMLTRQVREGLIREAIEKIDALASVIEKVSMIRVETLE